MADNKKYYYLKLKEGFFDSDEMIILESMTDGYLYSNILLKLYLRSLKNNGRLMFNDRIPFSSTMLSQVTRHNVGVVEKAMQIFQNLGLIEVMDNGAIYMADIQNFIGKSSTEADRIREYRNQIESEKTEQIGICTNVQQMSYKNTPEKELELELELEKEKEKKSEDEKKKYGEFENVSLSDSEIDKLDERLGDIGRGEYIERLSSYLAQTGKRYKSHYATILNWWNREGRPVNRTPKPVVIKPDKEREITPDMTAEELF